MQICKYEFSDPDMCRMGVNEMTEEFGQFNNYQSGWSYDTNHYRDIEINSDIDNLEIAKKICERNKGTYRSLR